MEAAALRREGRAVVVADLASRRADGEETVRLVHEAGGKAVFSVADVTRAADHEALADLAAVPVDGGATAGIGAPPGGG